jgi:hypothetical protein
MSQKAATLAGIVLQLIGSGWLVYAAASTAQKLRNFEASLTYEKLHQTLVLLAGEVAGQFQQQIAGFVCLGVGAGLQIYGAI